MYPPIDNAARRGILLGMTSTPRPCRSLNVHPAHAHCPGVTVPDGIEQTPARYADIQVNDIVAFGSCAAEHVVLDHPCTGNGQLMVECIKATRKDAVGVVRALFEANTDVYRVEQRPNR